MKSIQPFFEQTKKKHSENIPKKHQKRIDRGCVHINKNLIDRLPVLNYPKHDSTEHKSDIEKVSFYYANPSLNDSFLNLSNK